MKGKNFLITKDQERSKKLEEILKREKNNLFFAPLFDIHYLKNKISRVDFGAIIITSANAIKSLIDLNIDKNIEIFSVGNMTSCELQEAGFDNIKTAKNQDALSLKELVIENYQKDLPILYLCGDKITLDFQKELRAVNIEVEKYVSYRTKKKNTLCPKLAHLNFDYILIFSKYSAQIFLEIVAQDEQLKNNFKLAKILCLSNKIADEFKNSDFKNIGNFHTLNILKEHYYYEKNT